MRSSSLLAQLMLCFSTTQAFYIYGELYAEKDKNERSTQAQGLKGATLGLKQRVGPSTDPDRVAREAARLKSKYARKSQSQSPTKRDNNYDILEAEDPESEFTAGIDQNGNDISYFVQVQVGSEGKELYMLIDTGAGSTWIMGSECDSLSCQLHDSFGPEDSDTFEGDDKTFSIAYGSGEVEGTLARDTISVAGLSFDFQFGIATETSDDFQHFPFDGILGLSRNSGVSENFLEMMAEDGDIENNIFAVSLHRASDGPNTGHIRFGSTDPEEHEGDISYTSTINDEDWALAIEEMAFDGNAAGVEGMKCYIDTGTSYIFGPPDAVEAIHSQIPGASSDNGAQWTVPCDLEGTLTFTFSGVAYELQTSDWVAPENDGVCASYIYGQEFVAESWILGDAFLKNVYAVFDMDQQRIGFAAQAQESEESTSTVTTSLPETTSMSSSEMVMTTTFTTNNSTIVATAIVPEATQGFGGGDPDDEEPAQETQGTDEPDSSADGGYSNARSAMVVGAALAMLML